jgi:hypothetical protein
VGRDFDRRARLEVVEHEAHRWVLRTRVTMRAYDGHDPQRRRIVRYEQLRADTEAEVGKLLEWLGVSAPYSDRVAANAFEAIPAEQRGPGHFHRAATPGGWRENLTAEEQAVCRQVMGELLDELGYPAG